MNYALDLLLTGSLVFIAAVAVYSAITIILGPAIPYTLSALEAISLWTMGMVGAHTTMQEGYLRISKVIKEMRS